MSKLQRYYYTRGGLVKEYIDNMIPWCKADDVVQLEENNELLRALLQRVVRETRRHRVDWTPASNWLATSHNGTPHYYEYRIMDDLLRDIKYALNPEQKEHDND